MKRILLVMAVIVALVLASCGNKKATPAEPTAVDSTAVATEVVVDTLVIE